jgi:hypothetical protein
MLSVSFVQVIMLDPNIARRFQSGATLCRPGTRPMSREG